MDLSKLLSYVVDAHINDLITTEDLNVISKVIFNRMENPIEKETI